MINARPIFAGIVLTLAVAAPATPENWKAFRTFYAIQAESLIDKTGCQTCHTNPPRRNEYGRALNQALGQSSAGRVTGDVLASIEAIDSDGDGVANGDEIRAGSLPGNAESKPDANAIPAPTRAAEPISGGSLMDFIWPAHGHHPVVVHFPIALFLFGVALEFLGARRKDSSMRKAGWWNLLFGALSCAVVIPTGLIAFFRNGYAWEGTVLLHFILALVSTALMVACVLWRKGREPESKGYFGLLILTALVVGAAGHFGGQLVFG